MRVTIYFFMSPECLRFESILYGGFLFLNLSFVLFRDDKFVNT